MPETMGVPDIAPKIEAPAPVAVKPSIVEAPAVSNTSTGSLANESLLDKNATGTGTYAADPVEASFDLSKGNTSEVQAKQPETSVEIAEPKVDPQTELDGLRRQAQDYNRKLDELDKKSRESGKPLSTSDYLSSVELSGRLQSTQMLNLQKEIELAKDDPEKAKELQGHRREIAEKMLKENDQIQEELGQRAVKAFFGEDQEDLGNVQIKELLGAWAKTEGRKDNLNALLIDAEGLNEKQQNVVEEAMQESETDAETVPVAEALDLLGEQKTVVESWKGVTDQVDINYQLAMINFAMAIALIAEAQEDPQMKAIMTSVVGNLTAMLAISIAREQKKYKLEIKRIATEDAKEKEAAQKQEKKKGWKELLKMIVRKIFSLDEEKLAIQGMKVKPEGLSSLSKGALVEKMDGREVADRLSKLIAEPPKSSRTETDYNGTQSSFVVDFNKK